MVMIVLALQFQNYESLELLIGMEALLFLMLLFIIRLVLWVIKRKFWKTEAELLTEIEENMESKD